MKKEKRIYNFQLQITQLMNKDQILLNAFPALILFLFLVDILNLC
jgi:hypothetical protein